MFNVCNVKCDTDKESFHANQMGDLFLWLLFLIEQH